MTWRVDFSKDSLKFLAANHLFKDQVLDLVKKAILKFRGEAININIKKLKGPWAGFYRISKGDLRVIVEFNFDEFFVYIEVIDWRGGVYK